MLLQSLKLHGSLRYLSRTRERSSKARAHTVCHINDAATTGVVVLHVEYAFMNAAARTCLRTTTTLTVPR